MADINFATNDSERIASSCVCCGSLSLYKSPAVLMPFISHRVFSWQPVAIDESWGLRTIRSGNAYSICNSLRCGECGLLFLDIRFSENELGNLYSDYRGEAYTRLREHYEPGYSARNDLLRQGIQYVPEIEQFLTPLVPHAPRILDWGGDTGVNTPFKRCASTLDIYDISRPAVIPEARLIDKTQLMDVDYDLIVCSNVLEHVPYPKTLLSDIVAIMTDTTVLYLEIPYEDLLVASCGNLTPESLKRHWHEHVNFFTESAVRALVQSSGLVIVAFRVLEVPIYGKPSFMFQVACTLPSPVKAVE